MDAQVLKTVGGTTYYQLDDDGNLTLAGVLTAAGLTVSTGYVVSLAAGTAAAPSLTFTGDTDTGLYNVSANVMGVVAGGTEYVRVAHDAALPMVLVKGTGPVPVTQNPGSGSATVAGSGTVSAAQHRAEQYYQDASGGSVTCTTRTAAQLVSDFPGVAVGMAVMLYGSSNHASNTSTISGGTGVTLVGSGAITQTGGTFRLVFTNVTASSEAVTMYRVG